MAPKRKSSSEAASSPGSKTTLDVDSLRSVVELLEASDITHLSWRRGEERLVIRRGHAAPYTASGPSPYVPASAPAPAPSTRFGSSASSAAPAATTPAAAAAADKPGQLVSSPFVGTFYRTPAPDQPSFVEMGSVVKKGQVLCIVEAMKLMNEIEAEAAGTIIEILAQNGQPVEFGQALFRIDPL